MNGYTLIIVATSYATNAALYKLPYDPVKDIAPVGMLHKGPFVLAVNNSVSATNVKEFIELARAKPRGLTYGSSGTSTHPGTACGRRTEHPRRSSRGSIRRSGAC